MGAPLCAPSPYTRLEKRTVILSGFEGVGYRATGVPRRACVYLPHTYDLTKMKSGLNIPTMHPVTPKPNNQMESPFDPWSPATPRTLRDVPYGVTIDPKGNISYHGEDGDLTLAEVYDSVKYIMRKGHGV